MASMLNLFGKVYAYFVADSRDQRELQKLLQQIPVRTIASGILQENIMGPVGFEPTTSSAPG